MVTSITPAKNLLPKNAVIYPAPFFNLLIPPDLSRQKPENIPLIRYIRTGIGVGNMPGRGVVRAIDIEAIKKTP